MSKTQLIELCDKIRKDPTNTGYLFLLGISNCTEEEINTALDELDKN